MKRAARRDSKLLAKASLSDTLAQAPDQLVASSEDCSPSRAVKEEAQEPTNNAYTHDVLCTNLVLFAYKMELYCGGSELHPYAVEHSADGTAVTCWVASEAGKEFTVCWASEQTMKDLSCHLDIDGVDSDAHLVYAKSKARHNDEFKGALNTEFLGDIQVRVWHITVLGYSAKKYKPRHDLIETKVHEQAKKVTTHKIKPIDILRANGVILDTQTARDSESQPDALRASHASTSPARGRDSEGASIAVKEESHNDPSTDVPPEVADAPKSAKAEPAEQDQIPPPTSMGEEEGVDADAARIHALEEELRMLKKKAEIKALKKRLAELEGDGEPSGSKAPAKRVKRETSVIDLT
ncbi:hypothetical protein HWV62_16510 [Athelia sp. TMB]|nr:hypothetical protein HWV62_16510 [Athelia sp. TMB]